MKKSVCSILLLLILVLSLILYWFFSSYILIQDTLYPKDTLELILSTESLPDVSRLQKFTQLQVLDLRQSSVTIEQYNTLRSALPHCRILWTVPFQGNLYAEETTNITLTTLSEENIQQLSYLPFLKTVHAEQCSDYDALLALKSARPDLQVFYTVTIGTSIYPNSTTSLTLNDADIPSLLSSLSRLPNLKEITFTGKMPTLEQVSQIIELRPDIQCVWNFTVWGIDTSSMDKELILSNIPIESTSQLEQILPFFHQLERVEMCNCGISNEDMDALCKKYPDIRFIWTVKIGRSSLRTDATSFIPILHGYAANAVIRDPKQDAHNRLFDEDCVNFKYCTDMICLDLGHMGITDYSFVANMPKLKYLILADTQGTDFTPIQGLTDLVFLELFMTKFDQIELLPSLTSLRDLNLGFTTLTNTDSLKEMPWLERLWLPGTHLPSEIYQDIRTALPNTQVDYAGQHSTDRGWRRGYLYYEMRDALGMYYLS